MYHFNLYKQPNTTSNNGCLGSRIDEDRSELRYVMRTAVLVNHQIVERTLRFPLGKHFSLSVSSSHSLCQERFLGRVFLLELAPKDGLKMNDELATERASLHPRRV
jgi:hypothetical protein